jgi:LmbE family N-acetylglucosaminyl deacetylase
MVHRTLVALVTAGLVVSLGVVPASAATVASAAPRAAARAYVAPPGTKIDVMGEFAHPDDDTGLIGPCGVWHQRYGTRCGVIMVTRGEGGGNAAGPEIGPALGLRRENEDRAAHFRSGTIDVFNLDRVDFFYNQSAPLTQQFWDHDETLRRITRVIRTTQPEVYIGFTPTLAAGHGNHQQAGRFIWEGVLAAADPTMFPEQLRGPHALSTWQVKKVFSGGSTTGTGGNPTAPRCTAGFVPAPTNVDTVAGVWTGYDSRYRWPAGNVQGKAAGTPKIWQQVADEGRAAYPTQSRTMFQGTSVPACARFGMTQSFVPFQPNLRPDGTPNPAAGRDDAALLGASRRDPGGLPLGTLEFLTFSRPFAVAGTPFTATVHLRSGRGTLRGNRVRLTAPAGWSVSGPRRVRRVTTGRTTTLTFQVTPAADAVAGQDARVAATWRTRGRTGYTDNAVHLVAPAEGRFQRWGNWKEYDDWLTGVAPQATRLGRSPAVQSMPVGSTAPVPVVVHNWSDRPQQGTVSLQLPAGLTADAASKPYDSVAPGAETTVTFQVTSTQAAPPADQNVSIPIATTSSAPAGSSSETLTMTLRPATTVPQATTAPTNDGVASPGEYPGPMLDLGRIWQGATGCTGTADCGTDTVPGDGTGSWARASWSGDALHFFVHVVDDFQSYAVTPEECVGHWQADSVEFLIDPRGTSSQQLTDTASTFKLGVFPFTNDPANRNGNGANGPCWERDADNHQGYSTGPLAATVNNAPNAPGVQVATTARWVGSNETTTDHAYTGGGYDLEVTVPMADLPAAVDPAHLGLNITPYDNDDTAAAGTTTLRHIDASTRLAWSALGSVQSDPYRWGAATLAGYTPPADRPTTAPTPDVSHPNLDGLLSPQTIAQSARNGVPVSGRTPVGPRRALTATRARVTRTGVTLDLRTRSRGTAHAFVWTGAVGAIPVYTTSCPAAADPPPDNGFTPCSLSDGGIPAWSPDQSGHVLAFASTRVHRGTQRLSLGLSPRQRVAARRDGRLLVSYETRAGRVQALSVRLRRR